MALRTLLERLIGALELLVAAAFGLGAVAGFLGANAPRPTGPQSTASLEGSGWSVVLLVVCVPLLGVFAVAGVTMVRGTPRRWWYQGLAVLGFLLLGLLGLGI